MQTPCQLFWEVTENKGLPLCWTLETPRAWLHLWILEAIRGPFTGLLGPWHGLCIGKKGEKMLIEMTHQTRVKGLIVEPGDTIETTAKEAQFLVRMGWARRLTPSPERELAVASSGETRRAK